MTEDHCTPYLAHTTFPTKSKQAPETMDSVESMPKITSFCLRLAFLNVSVNMADVVLMEV